MVRVEVWEYERGWGSKLEEVKEFASRDEANAFVEEFNSQNTEPTAPDWYMVARISTQEQNNG